MLDKIRNLISAGRTEEVFDLLEQTDSAILLKARYTNGKGQYNKGLISPDDWFRIQNQVNNSILELAMEKQGPAPAPAPEQPGASAPAAGARKAFISYSHEDAAAARQVSDFLEANAVDVLLDEDDLPAGESIMKFIQDSIRDSDAVVTIVSANSLQSSWVGQESTAIIYAVWLADKKFVPVRLDDVAFDIDFQIAAQEGISQKIVDMDAKIAKLRGLGGDTRAFDDDRNRLFELKNNLGQIIQRLRAVRTVDISGDNFQLNMPRVLERIRQGGN